MSGKKKYYVAALAVLALAAVLAAAYALLSARTFYPDLVFSKVREAAAAAGYDLAAERLEGNPVTGVLAGGVTVSQGGESVMTASGLEMRLALRSLLSGQPKLARMTLTGLRADYDELARHRPAQREGDSGPPALDRLLLRDAALRTQWGVLSVDRGRADIGADRYDVSLRGSFAEKPLTAEGTYIKEGKFARLRGAALEWAGQRAEAEGSLSPALSLDCGLEGIDAAALSELLPALKKSTVEGVYSGRAALTKEGAAPLSVRAQVESKAGRVWRLPFEGLRADVTYTKNTIELANVRASVFGAKAEGDAAIALSGTPRLSARFELRNLETAAMVPEFDFLEKFPASVSFASCDIEGPIDSPSGPVCLEVPKLKAGEYEVSGAKARVVLRGLEALQVTCSGNVLGSSAKASGTVALSKPNSLDLDVSLRPLSLAALARHVPAIGRMKLAGEGSASAKLLGPADALTASGSASFPKLNVQGRTLDDVRAEFAYGPSGLSLKSARALWNGAEITASGASPSPATASADRTLDFRGTLSKLDLKALGGEVSAIRKNELRGVAAGRWTLGGAAKDPVVSFDLALPRLTAGKYATLSDVALRGSYRSPDVAVTRAEARLGGASASAAGRVTLPGGKPPAYEFKGNFRGLQPGDVPALLEKLPGSADLSGTLNGDLQVWTGEKGAPQARVFLRNSALQTAKVGFLDITGGVEVAGEGIRITNILARLYQGRLRLNGLIAAAEEEGGGLPIDLRLEATSLDVGRVARIFSPSAHGYQGLIVASADIGGTTARPRFTANGSILGVRAFGLFLPRIRFLKVVGGPDSVSLPEIQAIVGRGRIEASGALEREGDHWSGSVKASGKSVDVRSMTFSLEDEMRRTITGALDFDFEGKGSLSAFAGSGALTVPNLNVMGFRLSNVRAPFFVSEGFVMVEDSSARAYGGDVMLQVAKDLKASSWGGRVEITSADLAPVLPELMPDAGGKITGRANLKMRFGGDSRRTSMQSGEGSLEVTDGEISGFAGLAALAKVTGGRPLRFKSAHGSFNIDGKTLYLLPGSRIAAAKNDPVFKYVMTDGSVSLAKSMDLSCVGNVNIRALNMLAGAMQGLMVAAVDGGGSDGLLQNFLGGAITGFSRNEFRDVSLQVKGAPGALKFQNVKVAQQEKVDLMPDALTTPEGSRQKEAGKIQLNLEFPVGPGSSGGEDGAASQVGGQVLEQAIKGVLRF